jgi:K+-transporting ATPase A subunit
MMMRSMRPVAVLAALVLVPGLATWLPDLMMGPVAPR